MSMCSRSRNRPGLGALLGGAALTVALSGCDAPMRGDHPGVVLRDSAGITLVESKDSLWAEDRWLLDAPVTVVGAPGVVLERVVGAERLTDGSVVVLDAGSGLLRWFDADGALRVGVGGLGEGPAEFRSPSALVASGGDTVAVWDSGAGAIVGWLEGEQQFRTDFAVSGDFWYVADGAPRFDAAGRSWGQIERRDRNGAVRGIIRLPAARGAVTEAEREAYLAAVQDLSSAPPEMAAAIAEAVFFPDDHPAFGPLLVDPAGNLWLHAGVVRTPLPRDGPWRVLDRDGGWLGTVAMPAGFEPLSISDDHLTGVRRDPLGVEEVWVLPILR